MPWRCCGDVIRLSRSPARFAASNAAVAAVLLRAYGRRNRQDMGTRAISAVGPTGRGAWIRAAVAGAVAAAAAMGVGELVAGLVPGAPSLVVAIGSLVISLQPPGAKDLMVSLFGTNDKLALNLIVVAAAIVAAGAIGAMARRSWRSAAVAFAVVGLMAGWAAVTVQAADPLRSTLSAGLGTAAGIAVLWMLLREAERGPVAVSADAGTRGAGAARRVAEPMPDWGRRRFLLTSGGLVVGSLAAGALGRALLDRAHPTGQVSAATLPTPPPGSSPPALASDQSLTAPGLTPIVMPADKFYRIDTALLVPQVDASSWQLKVAGMVTTPLTFTYEQLLAMPQFEQYVTIACVSNEVGGNLVGNALWRGVHLKQALAMAGVNPAATQIVGRSVDGFTVGFPTAWATDPAREPMIAVGMNGAPLPAEHGYPARLIVPGLYGYVSATKWLSEIQLTTLEAFDAYWVNLGWAKEGPILTQSRIDHPQDGDHLAAGQVWIDGLAWAPDRGVSGVEVRVDGGPWQKTMTSRPISKATWVQWMLTWQATAGQHTIEVRATDGTGAVQTADRTPPPPDGARGHHTITVFVG